MFQKRARKATATAKPVNTSGADLIAVCSRSKPVLKGVRNSWA
jgi:hypothetical protein